MYSFYTFSFVHIKRVHNRSNLFYKIELLDKLLLNFQMNHILQLFLVFVYYYMVLIFLPFHTIIEIHEKLVSF
nr:MAG TPA: hypothetical protein [Bacteriophage sp.]